MKEWKKTVWEQVFVRAYWEVSIIQIQCQRSRLSGNDSPNKQRYKEGPVLTLELTFCEDS